MKFDPKFWTWDATQWKAGGKHIVSFAAGGVAVAAALHFISPKDATDLSGNLNDVYNGAMQFAKGIAGIVAVLTPIYTAFKAAHNASAASNIQRVETIANDPAQPQAQDAQTALIHATATVANDLTKVQAPEAQVVLINAMSSMASGGQVASVEAKKALVTATDALPEVAGVVTKSTAAGVALSNSVPSETIVPSGTAEATKIAA